MGLFRHVNEGQWISWWNVAQGGDARQKEKKRFMDVVRKDMQIVGAGEDDAEDRQRWRSMTRCGDS